MKQARILKIVVASPSDVQAERDMIPATTDELNKSSASNSQMKEVPKNDSYFFISQHLGA
jgi:hypothetical protein